MNHRARDLERYSEEYSKLPFEITQARYRRREVLCQIERHSPKKVLEIGCGLNPLFIDFSDDKKFVVVEPTRKFYELAMLHADGNSNVEVINEYFEDFEPQTSFDLIIVSCLLHEVPDQKLFLRKLASICHKGTLVHINVPSSESLHRRLAVAMELINNITDASEIQKIMQQGATVFSRESLENLLFEFGFKVVESGGIFLKPFTHGQMQNLVDAEIITEEVLDGLFILGRERPEIASEIWVNVSL